MLARESIDELVINELRGADSSPGKGSLFFLTLCHPEIDLPGDTLSISLLKGSYPKIINALNCNRTTANAKLLIVFCRAILLKF